MFASIHIPRAEPSQSDALRTLAEAFSPWVEMTAPDTVVFSLRGLGKLMGAPQEIARTIAWRAERSGLQANVAVAANPDAAILASHNFSGVTVIGEGEEEQVLGRLPIEALPLTPDLFVTLDRWGIRRLDELAKLPEAGLSDRLGDQAVYLQRLARGATTRALRPDTPGASNEETLDLEHPIELLEPLLFLISRFLHDLCRRLEAASLAAGAIHLKLKLDGGEHERILRLPFPARDPKFLLKLMQLDLEAHPPAGPVAAITLAMEPVQPRILQNGLFTPAAPEPEKLELTLNKIRAMVGEQNVGTPALVDTYRPDAWTLHRGAGTPVSHVDTRVDARTRLAFRFFRPPKPATVDLESGIPRRISAPGVRGKVVQVAGPWRSSGDWWKADSAVNGWDRDEWDLVLSDGALYRIYLDRPRAGWFVEGSYD